MSSSGFCFENKNAHITIVAEGARWRTHLRTLARQFDKNLKFIVGENGDSMDLTAATRLF